MNLRKVVPIMAMLMIVLVAGCKKEDDFEGDVGLCPLVVSTNPSNEATGVSLSQIVTATFNEKMDPATFTQETFLLKGANQVQGSVSYTDSTVSFIPATSLAPNTLYTGTIKSLVKDKLGNALQTDHIWTFTTNLSPGVILTDPLNDATNVNVDQVIAATFSVPMDPQTFNMATFTLKRGTVPIAGTITYSGSTALFTPTSLLVPGNVYTVTLTTGIKNEKGLPLESDYVWTFNTGGVPAITSTDPANYANDVALDKTVTAIFSEEMDAATINNSTFTIWQGAIKIYGTITYEGTTATYNPTNNFLYGTTYTATITNGAKNVAGKSIGSDYVWTFTTNNVVPPTIVSTDPFNGAIGIELDKNISATFSVPMNEADFNNSTFTVKQGANNVPGTITYNGSTVTFNPTDKLLYNKVYDATISATVKNLDGTAMEGIYYWSFTTKEATPPTVTSTSPANNAPGVELDQTITATFSMAMDETSLNASTVTVKQGSNTVPGAISFNGSTVSFDPTNNLDFSSIYTVTITTGAKSSEGTNMVNNYEWTFTTKEAPKPTIILTDPANNENDVPLNKAISAAFSVPMDPTSFNTTTFTLKQGSTTVSGTVTYLGTAATFTPTNNLISGTTYTATITNGVKDAIGTNMDNSYSWTFSTVAPLGPQAINLKTVARFGIFAGELISNNTGDTEIRNMDVGLTPGLRASITGFPPATVINGSIYAADDGEAVADMLIQAKLDLTEAYKYAEALTFPTPEVLGFDIGGQTLEPGLYKSESTMLIQDGNVILDGKGDSNAVWIFQIASGLNTIGGNGGNVVLTNGAQAKNVYWQVGNSAALGEGTTFFGNIIALNSITMNIGSTITGRLLTRHNAVYINTVIINKP